MQIAILGLLGSYVFCGATICAYHIMKIHESMLDHNRTRQKDKKNEKVITAHHHISSLKRIWAWPHTLVTSTVAAVKWARTLGDS